MDPRPPNAIQQRVAYQQQEQGFSMVFDVYRSPLARLYRLPGQRGRREPWRIGALVVDAALVVMLLVLGLFGFVLVQVLLLKAPYALLLGILPLIYLFFALPSRIDLSPTATLTVDRGILQVTSRDACRFSCRLDQLTVQTDARTLRLGGTDRLPLKVIWDDPTRAWVEQRLKHAIDAYGNASMVPAALRQRVLE